jgi:hypothetical protein
MPDKPNPEELALRVVQASKATRERDCHRKLAALLAKYHCKLVAKQEWTNGQPGPFRLKVVAE